MIETIGAIARIKVNIVTFYALVFMGMTVGFLALNASINSNTNAAVAEFRAETRADSAEINADSAEVKALRAEIKALRESLDARLDEIEVEQARMRDEINVLRGAGAP